MKSQFSASDDCASLAPFLTALFDGEADDEAARRARAHLLNCQACARLWLDWNQHRRILQSEVVPPPPPTLLWRVLIACRVTGFARPARRGPRAASFAPHLHLRELEAPLPPDLSAHILARTTRAPGAKSALPAPTPRARVSAPGARFALPARQGAPFRRRRLTLLAAPALALWLLLLSRSNFTALSPVPLPVQTFAPTEASRALAPRLLAEPHKAATGAGSHRVATKNSGAHALDAPRADDETAAPATIAQPLAESVAEPVENARFSENRAHRARAAFENAAPLRPAAQLSRVMFAALSAAESAARRDNASAQLVSFEEPAGARRTRAPRPGFEFAGASARRELARRELAQPALASPRAIALVAPRLRPATLSGAQASPRPRVARSSAAGKRLARLVPDDDETTLRVSRPSAGAPALREVNLSGAEPSGPRVEDLRSAVDDFRASISDDSSAEF